MNTSQHQYWSPGQGLSVFATLLLTLLNELLCNLQFVKVSVTGQISRAQCRQHNVHGCTTEPSMAQAKCKSTLLEALTSHA
jgi:hypothetical protein